MAEVDDYNLEMGGWALVDAQSTFKCVEGMLMDDQLSSGFMKMGNAGAPSSRREGGESVLCKNCEEIQQSKRR